MKFPFVFLPCHYFKHLKLYCKDFLKKALFMLLKFTGITYFFLLCIPKY